MNRIFEKNFVLMYVPYRFHYSTSIYLFNFRSYQQLQQPFPIHQNEDYHSDVKTCDFRSFKSDVNDTPTLAEYLKKSTVKAIAFKNGIPEDAKASLAEAVRKGGLKIQYFA